MEEGREDPEQAVRRSSAAETPRVSFAAGPEETADERGPASLSQPKSVPQVIELIGFGWSNILPIIFAGAFFIAEGAEMQIVSATAEVLKPLWGGGKSTASIMVSCVMAGFCVGTLLSGVISDRFGRRPALIVGYLGTAILGALPTLTTDFWGFTSLRFLNGVACGIGVVTGNNYISEVAPSKYRMYLVVLSTGLCYGMGEVYAGCLIMHYMPTLSETEHWREVTILGTVPAWIIVIPCLLLFPESPAWLCSVGRAEEAAKILNSWSVTNGRALQVRAEDLLRPEPVSGSAERLHKVMIATNTRWITYPFIVLFACANMFVFGFSYFYAVLFKENSVDYSPAGSLLVQSLTGGTASMGMSLLVLATPIGHKKSLLLLGLSMASACVLISVLWMRADPFEAPAAWQVRLATVGCIITKMMGPAFLSVCYIFASESFPTPIRGTGVGMVAGLGRIGGITSPLIINQLKAENGEMTVFVLFAAIFAVVVSLFAQKIPRETKGLSLMDELPPSRGRQQRDTLAAAMAAPSGSIIAVLFTCSAAMGACYFSFLLYGSQIILATAGVLPAEEGKYRITVVAWGLMATLQAPGLLWWLGRYVEESMSERWGWGETVRVALVVPLVIVLLIQIGLMSIPLPNVGIALPFGVLLGASCFVMQDILIKLCLSIESSNSGVQQVGFATGALVPLAVIGLGHLTDDTWSVYTHVGFFVSPAILALTALVLVLYAYPSSDTEEEQSLLSGKRVSGGVKVQFRYALSIFEHWDKPSPDEEIREAPVLCCALVAAHHAILYALGPWVSHSGVALTCFVIVWIIAEFLGHYIVTMLSDTLNSYPIATGLGGGLLVVRLFIVIAGWDSLQTLGSGHAFGQFMMFLYCFIGVVSVAVLRRGLELSVANKGLRLAVLREASWVRAGSLLGLAVSGALVFTVGRPVAAA